MKEANHSDVSVSTRRHGGCVASTRRRREGRSTRWQQRERCRWWDRRQIGKLARIHARGTREVRAERVGQAQGGGRGREPTWRLGEEGRRGTWTCKPSIHSPIQNACEEATWIQATARKSKGHLCTHRCTQEQTRKQSKPCRCEEHGEGRQQGRKQRECAHTIQVLGAAHGRGTRTTSQDGRCAIGRGSDGRRHQGIPSER
mmetsp:Transcript_10242/g.62586  ORF Transcript_10242/g.62586 Transcript_10242/m.62586 type:complete len:201 (-) Transcript_10242:1562-2164(-)